MQVDGEAFFTSEILTQYNVYRYFSTAMSMNHGDSIIQQDLVQVVWHSEDYWNASEDPLHWRWAKGNVNIFGISDIN